MPIIDLNTINKDMATNPYLGKSQEELEAAERDLKLRLAVERKKQLMSAVNEGIQGTGDIFLQKGGIKVPEKKSSIADEINEFIAKERLKQMIAQEAPLSPSDELAKIRLDEINKRRGTQGSPVPVISTPTTPAQSTEEPPMYIQVPTGEIDEFTGERKVRSELNPKWTMWKEANKPKSSADVLTDLKRANVERQLSGQTPPATATPQTGVRITTDESMPPMFIKKSKGVNEYGIEEYEDIKNPEYEAWTKAQEKEREATVKSQRAMPATREFIKRYSESRQELMDKGFKSAGEATMKGFGQRMGASLFEKTGQLPTTTRFINRLSVIANASAREIEGGRITDQDRAVYASAMANALKFPDETNIGLVADNLIDLKNKGADISGLLNEFESSGQDIFVKIAQEARRIEGTGDDFSKMSDEELRAIMRGEK